MTFATTHKSLIEIHLSTKALHHNLSAFRTLHPNWHLLPVLKANAYGHGLVHIMKMLTKLSKSIPFVCVDSLHEAALIRNTTARLPVLVFDYSETKTLLSNKLTRVTCAVGSLAQLQELTRSRKKLRLHIKWDTGMHRQGISLGSLDEVVRLLQENSHIHIEGIFSHLAESEVEDSPHLHAQIESWNALVQKWRAVFPQTKYYHLANSGGWNAAHIDANAGRAGIALYGINSGNLPCELIPVLSMYSRIVDIKEIPQGERVGYNGTFTAKRTTRSALIPVGYFEGIDRRLSGKGILQVEGRPVAILGRVSMNMTSIDVTDIPNARIGSEVTIISNDPKNETSIEKQAQTAQTIPYDLLVHLPQSMYRKIVD